MKIKLPDASGKSETYKLQGEPLPVKKQRTPFNRVAFAAAHVVADPFSESDPSGPPAIDWDRTIAYRTHLLDLGFGIAEAMDTSQRGMGLDWPSALELRFTNEESASGKGHVVGGIRHAYFHKLR